MPKLNYLMNRRTFVKSGVRFLAAIVTFKVVRVTAAANTQAPSQAFAQTSSYGTGAYGQGTYLGEQVHTQQIHLPLLIKKEDEHATLTKVK